MGQFLDPLRFALYHIYVYILWVKYRQETVEVLIK